MNEHDRLTKEKFDKWAGHFEETGSAFRYFQKRVISIVNPTSPSNFLDLGCGTGWAVRYVATLLKGQGHFVGIDISEKMIKKAREVAEGMRNVAFYEASSEKLPLKDNFFDNVICTFSFHHYLRPQKALSEAHRVLTPGGRIYVLDGTSDDLFTRFIDSLARKIEKEHVRQYSTAEFKRMFTASGLTHVKSKVVLLYPTKVHIARK